MPTNRLLKSLISLFSRAAHRRDWSVEVAERGRDGHVYYHEPAGTITFYWEFGGGDVVAIISGDSEKTRKKNHPWAASRYREILERVASEVIRQKAPNCRAEIDEPKGCIYMR